MRKSIIFFLLFLICAFANSQTYQRVAPNEYATFTIDSVGRPGRLWASGGRANLWANGSVGRQALPTLVRQESGAPMPLFTKLYAGFTDALAIDVNSNVWHLGDAGVASAGDGSTHPPPSAGSMNYAQRIFTDSSGAAFTGITMAAQYFFIDGHTTKGWFVIKGTDSTLWMWGGDLLGGYRGTGVLRDYIPRPVQVIMPGNRKVVQVVAGNFVMVLCSDGTVWDWGGGGCNDYGIALGNGCNGNSWMYPRQVPGIANGRWIAGARNVAYVICGNDSVWAWGTKAMIGIGSNDGNPQTTPLYIKNLLNLPHGVVKIVTNISATHAILSDGTLWGWGSSPQGEVGNGAILDRNRPTYPANWSWDYHTQNFVISPVQLVPTRHDFVNIYGAMPYTYWFFDECANGQLYFNGRAKGATAMNGRINPDTSAGNQSSQYDQGWDIANSTPVNLFTLRDHILVPAAPCAINGSYPGCNGYILPPVLPPAINAGADQTGVGSTTTLTATSSPAPGRKVASYVWSQISGPGNAYFNTFNDSIAFVSSLVPGTYVFRITATDNLNSQASDDISVTTTGSPGNIPPAANAGTNQIIILPISITTLLGSGSDPDGAVVSYIWTQVSGTPATILTPSLPSTIVIGLTTTGPRVFRLTVTDNQGATGTSDVTITANIAAPPANQPPTAYAGANQSVNLPLSSVTLNGSGGDPDGSIASYAWTQVSGAAATIVSPSAASTNITGLTTTGVRVFRLTVTDNQGATATSDISVAVTNFSPTPFGGVRRLIPGKLEAEDYDNGGQNVGYYDGTNNNIGGAYRTTESVDLGNCGDNGGGYNMGWTTDGEWLKFSVTVTTTGAYTFTARVGTPNTGKSIQFQVDGSTVGTLNVPNTGGWTTWQTGTLSNVALTAGDHTFRFLFNTGDAGNDINGFDINWFNFTLVSNQPPVANAGANQIITLPTSGGTLSGSGSDPDGTIASYAWTQVSGIPATIASPSTAATNITGLTTAGIRVFRLTVTDNQGATGTSDVIIIVNASLPPPNQPPVANAGANQTIVLPTSGVTLSGSGSDPDGTIASYAWTQVSGTAATIASPSTASTDITGLTTAGVRVFRLTVTDNQGATAISDVVIIVNTAASPPNQLPVANAGINQTIVLPTSGVTLSGSGNDPDGTIAFYVWMQVSGTAATIASPLAASTDITGLTTAGIRVFRLTVIDNQGAMGTSDITITVNAAAPPPNQPPVANAGTDQTIVLPTSSATLSGSGNDPDGTIAFYVWMQVSGTPATIASPSTASTNITGLTTTGIRVFRLTVIDNQGAMGTSDITITVNAAAPPPNQPPVANAGANQTITLPASDVTLSGSGSDPDGTIASYVWTQVSGTAATIASPSSASTNITGLTTAGVRVFRLTVIDNQGALGLSDVIVIVNAAAPPPNQPPVANAGTNQTIILPTSGTSLSGSGSDPDGTIASYAWTQVSGTAATIASPSTASTNITGLTTAGIRIFRLTVTDNQGVTGTSDVIITVNAAAAPSNQPPVANAGLNNNITLPTNSVILAGSGTDPDGIIASYQWSKIAGPAQFTITSPTQVQTFVNNLEEGVYQFELKVTDNQGAIGKATVIVTVNPANSQPPTAHAGSDQTITLPVYSVIVTGSGTASDPDRPIVSYLWTKIAGPASNTIVSPTHAQTMINNLVKGIYQFEIKVTDSHGGFARDTVQIEVKEESVSTARIFPNPATTTINIEINAEKNTNSANISIYDSRGVVVYQEQFMRSQQLMVKQIDIDKYPRGIYFIAIVIDTGNKQTLTFVKQ